MPGLRGFRPERIGHEIKSRRKPREIRYPFSHNKKKWFDVSLKLSRINDVIEADVTKFDFSTVVPISFCLLDVDLYLAVAAAPNIASQCGNRVTIAARIICTMGRCRPMKSSSALGTWRES